MLTWANPASPERYLNVQLETAMSQGDSLNFTATKRSAEPFSHSCKEAFLGHLPFN